MGARWRINDGIALALLALLALSPLPLGSNRPMFWMLSACFVFLSAGVFFMAAARQAGAWPLPLRRLRVGVALAFAYLVFMALQVSGVLGEAGSIAPRASLLALLRTLSYATFFFLVLQVSAKPKRAAWMVDLILLLVVIYALIGFFARFGIVQFPEGLMPANSQNNATATFVNRNSYATFLGFGLLIAIAQATRKIRALNARNILALATPRVALYLAAALLIVVTLAATNSRMGVASVIFALAIFMFLLAAKRRKSGARAFMLGSVAVALGLGIGFYLYGGALLERLGSVERDADVRFALYRQVWDMIMARPWAGFGADSFELAFQSFHQLPVSPDLVWDKAHNSYLTNWAETGLIFGSIPLILLAMLLGFFGKTVFERPRNFVFPLLGLSVILQGGVHALMDFSLEIQANTYLFLAIIAIALADSLTARTHRRRKNVA